MIDVVLDVSGIYGQGPSNEAVRSAVLDRPIVEEPEQENPDLLQEDSAYDSESASVIRLSNGMVLYLKEVDTMLALVCITRSENFRRKSLINYNIGCLKRALQALAQPELPIAPPASLISQVVTE